MALSGKRGVKQVPWLSLAEWHDVYRQAYSNNTAEQTKAYETLLAWKVRMPKLPVGVDGTLMILQVCLRDREWTSKIDSGEQSLHCEKDLSLMYSTTIMRFLNHITAIGHTRQKSLYSIAKRLKIPNWIVGLRHSTAHGPELHPLGILKIAINILFEWLHDEYWAVEARAMEELYTKEVDAPEEEEEQEDSQTFVDLIELWTGVNLYIHAGYLLVSDIPDTQLQMTLQDLRQYVLLQHSKNTSDEDEDVKVNTDNVKSAKEYNLTAARTLLLYELSAYLTKNKSSLKKGDICNALCENEVFLPNSDIMTIFLLTKKGKKSWKKRYLPLDMVCFWKDIIILLHKKEMLDALVFKLLDIVYEERADNERRTLAASWINSLAYSFVQLDIAQSICRIMEHELQETDKRMSTKDLSQSVQERVYFSYPRFQSVLWLDLSSTMPRFLLDINFFSKLLLRINEFSMGLVKPILELVRPKIDTRTKKHLLNLLKIYTFQQCDDEDSNEDIRKIFTVDDLCKNSVENETLMHKEEHSKKSSIVLLADKTIRNSHWKSTFYTYQWIGCPIGLLPWQDSLKSLKLLEPNVHISRHSDPAQHSQIVAGIINNKNLKMKSCINWDNVLRKKRRIKRKRDKSVTDTIMNRALEVAKKQK